MLSNTLAQKREFIVWFLQNNRLKKPEAARILEFIRDNNRLLARIEFTDKISDKATGLMISAAHTATYPLEFRFNHGFYHKASDVLQILKNKVPRRLYLKLSFVCPPGCCLCADNHKPEPHHKPALPKAKSSPGNLYQKARKILFEAAETAMAREQQKNELLQRIDRSLELKNHLEFLKLSEMLRNLDNI